MDNYLFGQDIIIISSMLAAWASLVFIGRYRSLYNPKRTSIDIVAALLLLAIEIFITDRLFGLKNIPAASFVLIAICNFWLVAVFSRLNATSRYLINGGLAFITSLLLLALVINNYYQYFPNLSAVLASNYKKPELSTITSTQQRDRYNVASIEQLLFAQGQTKGTISTVAIPGTLSHLYTRDGYVYLPPAYNDASFTRTEFPVLILLTGTPGSPSSWLQGGIFVNIMDTFASHHDGITPIVVIADHSGSFTNDTECLNSSHGNAETYVTQDVPNYIKQHYRVSSNPVNWGIGGFSEGGMCAAMLTLTHQNIFRHFLDMSGDPYPYLNDMSQTLPVLFGGSRTAQKEHNIDWLINNAQLSPDITAEFAIGANDSRNLISEMRTTYHQANHRGIPATFEEIQHDGHSFNAWSRGYNDALPQLSYYLGATECETGCDLKQ